MKIPLLRLTLSATVALFASCAVFHAGAPAASLRVTATSGTAVEEAVVAAFTARGFHVAGNERGDITFEREAGKFDRAVYGNWNDDTLADRVVVQIIPGEAGTFRLSCLPFSVRSLGTGMEDATRHFQTFSNEYSAALRDVRRSLAGR